MLSLNSSSVLALALLVPFAACATLDGTSAGKFDRGGKLITAEQIQKTNARTAWEALSRTGNHLSLSDTPQGEPARVRYRGTNSLVLSSTPTIYVDGARIAGFEYLRDIPTELIENIRIFNGLEGTRYYGTGGGNGIIAVQTRAGPSEG